MTAPAKPAPAAQPSPPTVELGYANGAGDSWWSFTEETPELRWPESVAVYDRMPRQDAQVASVLRAVTLPVRRTQWRIEQAGARPEVAAKLAEDLGLPVQGEQLTDSRPIRSRDRFSWREHLSQALLCTRYGHMFFEQIGRIDADGYWRLRKLAPRMPRTISKINVASDGGLVSIEQNAPVLKAGTGRGTGPITIPVSRLVAYVNDREGGDWTGSSLLRSAYGPYNVKWRLIRVQAQMLERNGMGVPVYTGAPGASNEDLVAGEKLATSFRSGSGSGAGLPNGATLELKAPAGVLPDATPAIKMHDEYIGNAVLAQFLNLGEKSSYALGATFQDFFTMSLQTLAQLICDTAQQHVVEDWVDWNYGPDEPAPQLVFDEIGSRHQATAEAIKALVDAGVIIPDRVTEEAIRQLFGLPPKGYPPPAPITES